MKGKTESVRSVKAARVFLLRSLLVVAMGLMAVSCGHGGPPRPTERYSLFGPASENSAPAIDGTLKAHFICFHEGKCCLFELPNGELMLVDTGTQTTERKLWALLDKLGVSKLDHLIITSIGDSRYSGGLLPLANTMEITRFYMAPRGEGISVFSERLRAALLTMEAKGTDIVTVTSGSIVLDHENLRGEFLGPKDPEWSVAPFALVFGNHTFLFADDGTTPAEKDIAEAEGTPDVTVLSIAESHIVDYAPQTASFIAKCYPEIAVIYDHIDTSEAKRLDIRLVRPNDMASQIPPANTTVTIWTLETDGEEYTITKSKVVIG